MRTQTTRTIAGRVNADGTIATGQGFTSRKTAVGTYTVTFPPDFRFVSATVTVHGFNVGTITAGSVTGNSFGVLTANTAGTSLDLPFNFVAQGAGV